MADKKTIQSFDGNLYAHWETGMDAHAWCLEEGVKEGYDGLHVVEKGDLLTVFNDASRKKIIFQGEVDFEYDSHKQVRAIIGEVQWLKGIGHVHGIQKGVDGEEWGRMFSEGKPAILIKPPKP